MKKGILLFVLFVIVTAGIVGFWFYRDRMFSKEILRLEILGPESANMAEEVEYTVKYKNNGNFALENPRLIFELPDNSLTEDSKTRFSEELDDIYPGDEDFIKFKGRLLGKEGDLKVAKAWLSYTPKNLTARYESDTTFTTKIESVDITLDFDLATKSERGKEAQYNLNYFSNIDYPLENLSVKIELSAGFELRNSEPSSLDGQEWKIPTLTKAAGGRIKNSGLVSAATGSLIDFKAQIGMWVDGQFIVIKESIAQMQVIEPKIFISQQIQGAINYAASPGEELHYEIFFRNIGSTPFENLLAIVRFDGLAFDLSTARAFGGDVRAGDNLIAFDYRNAPQLRHLDPQQEGKLEFTIKLKDSQALGVEAKNGMTIKNIVQVAEVSQEFVTKVNSKIEISQQAFYTNTADIQNYGPLPPVVGQPTTFVISWHVKNFQNDAKNVKVRAVLPQGVFLTGFLTPDSEYPKFFLDSLSRELVWSVGDVMAGSQVQPLYFQVSFTPQQFQRGAAAILIGQATVFAEDQFTGSTVQGSSSAVSTNLPHDPPYSERGIIK